MHFCPNWFNSLSPHYPYFRKKQNNAVSLYQVPLSKSAYKTICDSKKKKKKGKNPTINLTPPLVINN